MTTPATTAFGAALGSPAQTAAVLRARASAAGTRLGTASSSDLCAAVLAAHCWALTHGRTALTGTMTAAEAADLSAALARAAGHASQHEVPEVELWDRPVEDLPVRVLALVAPVVTWACEHGGADAVRRAAYDLTDAHSPHLSSLAALLSGWELEHAAAPS